MKNLQKEKTASSIGVDRRQSSVFENTYVINDNDSLANTALAKINKIRRNFKMHYNKVKAGLSLTQECQNLLEQNKFIDGSGSKNELAENAIRFYIAYQHSVKHRDYLTKTLTYGAAEMIKETEDRIARMAYKIAVEMAMSNLILLNLLQADERAIQKYRRKAVEILKQSKGFLSLDQANRFRAQEVYDGVRRILKGSFVYEEEDE